MEPSAAPNISPCPHLCTSSLLYRIVCFTWSSSPALSLHTLPATSLCASPTIPYPWVMPTHLISSNEPGVILETGKEKWWSGLSMLTDRHLGCSCCFGEPGQWS